MTASPEALLIRALMLLPLPSPMLLDIARHQSGVGQEGSVRGGDSVGGGGAGPANHFRTLVPFEAFAKVLSAYHPAEKKYGCVAPSMNE